MREDIKEMLRKWDNGETVWSVEMGGLGPGYEQCIQVMMIEICRKAVNDPLLCEPIPEDKEKQQVYIDRFKKTADESIHEIAKKIGGPSGAQAGAATQIAFKFFDFGIEKALAMPEIQDRKIQIDNYWPKV